jgi:inosose dehydratase
VTTISPVTQDTTGTLAPTPDGHRPVAARIAGAPISWGVCEVPGWGYQLGPDRVLAEMREIGLTATEFGPDGFLPTQPDAMTRVLDHHGLQAIGGFTPLLLHVAGHDPVPEVERLLQGYDASGAEVLVLSAVTGAEATTAGRCSTTTSGWCCSATSTGWRS